MCCGVKYCPKCKMTKPETEFYYDKTRTAKNKLSGYCKECRRTAATQRAKQNRTKNRQYSKQYYAAHKKQYRRYILLKSYGITQDDYDQLLSKQKHRCAICHRHESMCAKGRSLGPRLCVDHCHKTGVVRGLLCHSCNHRLDFLSTPSIVRRTIAYLKQSTNR